MSDGEKPHLHTGPPTAGCQVMFVLTFVAAAATDVAATATAAIVCLEVSSRTSTSTFHVY